MNLQDAVDILKKSGLSLPYQIQKAATNEAYSKRGTVQVWACIKCGFRYEAPIKCLEVRCKQDHDCSVVWSAENQ